MVHLLIHAAVDGAGKQIAPVEEHLCAGRVGHGVHHAVDVGVLLGRSRQEAAEQAGDGGVNLLQRAQDALGKAAQPRHIQAQHVKDGIVAQTVEGLVDFVVGVDGDVDGNLRLPGIEPGHVTHDVGSRAVEREHVDGRGGEARRAGREPATKAGVVHDADLRGLLFLDLPYQHPRRRIAEQTVVQLVFVKIHLRQGVNRRNRVNDGLFLGIEGDQHVAGRLREGRAGGKDGVGLGQGLRLQHILEAAPVVGLHGGNPDRRPLQTLRKPTVKGRGMRKAGRVGNQPHMTVPFFQRLFGHVPSGLFIVEADVVRLKTRPALHEQKPHLRPRAVDRLIAAVMQTA